MIERSVCEVCRGNVNSINYHYHEGGRLLSFKVRLHPKLEYKLRDVSLNSGPRPLSNSN